MLQRAVGIGQIIGFHHQSWVDEAAGVRALVCDVDGSRWAVVEYAPGSGRDEWCQVGHSGYVIAGEIQYHFEDGTTLTARAGDGFVLPAGHRHRGTNERSERARLLVIDDRP